MTIFLLGAGFSKPAGLPLGNELFTEIIEVAQERQLYKILESDIQSFQDYVYRTRGTPISKEQINFEEFISYLDVEHFLMLKGSDQWTEEGNKSQIIIRNLLALTLHVRQSRMTNADFALYESFADKLKPGDWIISFNYDTVLENIFSRKGMPYRLFPTRYVRKGYSKISESDETEIVLLKMHGSIDWFDITSYENQCHYLRQQGTYFRPPNAIFENYQEVWPEKIVDGAYPKDSPLHNIYKIRDLAKYFRESDLVVETPLIISPSFNKLAYLNPLREFWRGFNNAGVFQDKVAIIGFSLPEHDEYIRQPLFRLIDNFQNRNPQASWLHKSNLKVVDFRENKGAASTYQKKFAFINWEKTDCCFTGFDNRAINMIFDDS